MTQPSEPDFLAIINERGSGTLDKKMGIQIIEASPERLVGTMPVEGNTQPFGLLLVVPMLSLQKVSALSEHIYMQVLRAKLSASISMQLITNQQRQELLRVLQPQSHSAKPCVAMRL